MKDRLEKHEADVRIGRNKVVTDRFNGDGHSVSSRWGERFIVH